MFVKKIRASKFIIVNTTTKKISLYQGRKIVKTYPIAVGKSTTPTPTGQYKIVTKILHPGGALGTRWMGLSIPNGHYGIHGTNKPSSIGKTVSNGCIRMYNEDIEELFPMVNIGTPVVVTDAAEYSEPLNEPLKKDQHYPEAGLQFEPPEKETDLTPGDTYNEQHEEYEPAEQKEEDKTPSENQEGTMDSPEGFKYTVRPGDTLWSIARSFGLPVQLLVEANSLENPNWLYPGQKIFIPK
ncbi:MAG: L,D-transpeptidase family protein [Desulfotomaculum sp.]|nr:L,D-transpeptidase family protein [Desulfotomaculum sp.]